MRPILAVAVLTTLLPLSTAHAVEAPENLCTTLKFMDETVGKLYLDALTDNHSTEATTDNDYLVRKTLMSNWDRTNIDWYSDHFSRLYYRTEGFINAAKQAGRMDLVEAQYEHFESIPFYGSSELCPKIIVRTANSL